MGNFKFDPDELLKDELTLTKIDVAHRQLDSAIELFFFNWDEVTLHTVTAAAHGVLYDLSRHKGIKKSFKDSNLIKEEERKKYLNAVNYPQNFFKHADTDPDGKMIFRFNGTPFLILDSVMLYLSLDQSITYKMQIFLMWVQLRFPDLLCLDKAEYDLKQIRNTTENPSAFKALARQLIIDSKAGKKSN